MLSLWRPPQRAGDPIGCLATTYTFEPGMFDEQCLARFLEIESEPNREDLAFLLERESRLGSVYAGVLVDYTQAGVEHSLRWDVLPVRIRGGKQHAKLSLLVWTQHVRIIVASSNITEPGYRTNYEVAGAVECTPKNANQDKLAAGASLPAGFLAATYRAGDERHIVVRLDPEALPEAWRIFACGRDEQELLSCSGWAERGRPAVVEFAWTPVQPPEKLLVRWGDHEAFLPLNVEDSRRLPPLAQLEKMSADDMLLILAASDPSGAFRVWVNRQQSAVEGESDLDSAVPADLDPLRRYDLQATYLHRIRRRARVLAQLRANLQRPVWGRQALEGRLRGMVGIEQLADRLLRELDGSTGEGLLSLADFLIVLHEVDYEASAGSLPKVEFDQIFRTFLKELAEKLAEATTVHRGQVSEALLDFWDRVVQRCAV